MNLKEISKSTKYLVESLHVEGFWEMYNVDLKFDKDVNILTGINGSGKTTILEIIFSMLSQYSNTHPVRKKYESARLVLVNGAEVETKYNSKHDSITSYKINGQFCKFEDLARHLLICIVSNIDGAIPNVEEQKKLKDAQPDIFTDLDYHLGKWISLYNRYMSSISRRIDTLVKENKVGEVQSLFSTAHKMESLCNDLLKNRKKWHVTDDGHIEFIVQDGSDKAITPFQLSSGEKQILILLISTLVQDESPYIVFWDEPELSLHIEWQQKLIRVMRELNPNMQLIMATHSPNILYEGWENRVINVQDAFNHE